MSSTPVVKTVAVRKTLVILNVLLLGLELSLIGWFAVFTIVHFGWTFVVILPAFVLVLWATLAWNYVKYAIAQKEK